MKFKWGMSQEQKNEVVKKSMLRTARALQNACRIANKENRCGGCPFHVDFGRCNLHGHPINWDIKEA